MKKKIKKFSTYTSIITKILNWKWPEWPKDNPLGCANLLVEQCKLLNPYIIPIMKNISSAGNFDSYYTQQIYNQIHESYLMQKLTENLEAWIGKCPFFELGAQYIAFSSNPVISKDPSWLNKTYFSGCGLFMHKQVIGKKKLIRPRYDNWNVIKNLFNQILQYSNVVTYKKFVLLVNINPPTTSNESKVDARNIKYDAAAKQYKYSIEHEP